MRLLILLTRAWLVLIAERSGWLDLRPIVFWTSPLKLHATDSRLALAIMEEAFAGRSGTCINLASDARKPDLVLDWDNLRSERGGSVGGAGRDCDVDAWDNGL
jgi:hypothetical protein